jgi:hypothetical protein
LRLGRHKAYLAGSASFPGVGRTSSPGWAPALASHRAGWARSVTPRRGPLPPRPRGPGQCPGWASRPASPVGRRPAPPLSRLGWLPGWAPSSLHPAGPDQEDPAWLGFLSSAPPGWALRQFPGWAAARPLGRLSQAGIPSPGRDSLYRLDWLFYTVPAGPGRNSLAQAGLLPS